MLHQHLTSRVIIFLAALLAVFGAFFLFNIVRNAPVEPPISSLENAKKIENDKKIANQNSLIETPLAVSFGPRDAKVVFTEFLDFQCPFCREIAPSVKKLMATHAQDSVRFVFRHYPILESHRYALPTAYASICANDQGKFLEMHDIFYHEQESINEPFINAVAQRIGLDMAQFNACLGEKKYRHYIYKDVSDSLALGITGTPTIFVNTQRIVGASSYETYEKKILEELSK
jgi:protein-disulfide isomerase